MENLWEKLELFDRSFDHGLRLRWGYLKEDWSPVGEGGHGEAAYGENNRAAGMVIDRHDDRV